jgi:hypothetical protein
VFCCLSNHILIIVDAQSVRMLVGFTIACSLLLLLLLLLLCEDVPRGDCRAQPQGGHVAQCAGAPVGGESFSSSFVLFSLRVVFLLVRSRLWLVFTV